LRSFGSLLCGGKGIAQGLKKLKETPSKVRPIHPEKAIDWVSAEAPHRTRPGTERGRYPGGNLKDSGDHRRARDGEDHSHHGDPADLSTVETEDPPRRPTGRAAKRMSEATGWEARTIHRLLEYSPKKGGFTKNEEDLLEADLLIIDEASMVDTLLMYHLIKALRRRPISFWWGMSTNFRRSDRETF